MLSVNYDRTLWTRESVADKAGTDYAAACCLNIRISSV